MKPIFIGEASDKQGMESKNRLEQAPCRDSSSCIAVVQSEESLQDIATGSKTTMAKKASTSSSTVEHIVNEAIDLAEKIKATARVFDEQRLDAKRAHDYVLQRHLSGLQEQSRREI